MKLKQVKQIVKSVLKSILPTFVYYLFTKNRGIIPNNHVQLFCDIPEHDERLRQLREDLWNRMNSLPYEFNFETNEYERPEEYVRTEKMLSSLSVFGVHEGTHHEYPAADLKYRSNQVLNDPCSITDNDEADFAIIVEHEPYKPYKSLYINGFKQLLENSRTPSKITNYYDYLRCQKTELATMAGEKLENIRNLRKSCKDARREKEVVHYGMTTMIVGMAAFVSHVVVEDVTKSPEEHASNKEQATDDNAINEALIDPAKKLQAKMKAFADKRRKKGRYC